MGGLLELMRELKNSAGEKKYAFTATTAARLYLCPKNFPLINDPVVWVYVKNPEEWGSSFEFSEYSETENPKGLVLLKSNKNRIYREEMLGFKVAPIRVVINDLYRFSRNPWLSRYDKVARAMSRMKKENTQILITPSTVKTKYTNFSLYHGICKRRRF